MEDRLPLLIQKRLEAEIQQHPPLFPWETEVDEYDESEVEASKIDRDPSLQLRLINKIGSPFTARLDNDARPE